MTDKEKFKALMTEFGVGYKEKDMVSDEKDERGFTAVKLMEGYEKVDGYMRFFTLYNFDPDGKFIDVWCGE